MACGQLDTGYGGGVPDTGEQLMTTRKPRAEYVSLAPLFGENSVEAWTRTLLEDRLWCKGL